MIIVIRVENKRDVEIVLQHTENDQIGAEWSEVKWRRTRQIGEEQEHQGEREDMCQNEKMKLQ